MVVVDQVAQGTTIGEGTVEITHLNINRTQYNKHNYLHTKELYFMLITMCMHAMHAKALFETLCTAYIIVQQ